MATSICTLIYDEPGAIPCLSVVGEIDGCTLAPFETALCALIHRATDRARLDLTTVTCFGTPGLRILSTWGDVAAEQHVTLMIQTSPCVRRVLGSAGFTPED